MRAEPLFIAFMSLAMLMITIVGMNPTNKYVLMVSSFLSALFIALSSSVYPKLRKRKTVASTLLTMAILLCLSNVYIPGKIGEAFQSTGLILFGITLLIFWSDIVGIITGRLIA